MVALLHPSPHAGPHSSGASAADPSTAPAVDGHPGLRLVVDNTRNPVDSPRQLSGSLPAVDRSLLLTVAVVAVAVFGSLFVLRAVQGSPASNDAVIGGSSGDVLSVGTQAGVIAAPGDQIVVAKAGDSMWSIAVSLSPGSDPRPAVAALIEANGGDSVRIGQQIVIPEQLLD